MAARSILSHRSFAEALKGEGSFRPSSPRTEKKSFAGVTSGGFPLHPVSVFKGEPAIFFSKDDIETLAKPFKFALVGKFASKNRPLMSKIRNFFVGLGLKNLISVGLLHDSFILIHVAYEEDYTRLLMRALWYVEGCAMKVFKWTPSFTPFEDSPAVSVWVGFPCLAIHFFNRSALFSIASAIGTPLKSDEPTALLSRPSVARVCIDLDVSKTWPERIWLGDEKSGFWQDVIVENPPLFCSHCKILGHKEDGCFRLHPDLPIEKAKNAKEAEIRKKKVFHPIQKQVMSENETQVAQDINIQFNKNGPSIPEVPPLGISLSTWKAATDLGIALTPFKVRNPINVEENELQIQPLDPSSMGLQVDKDISIHLKSNPSSDKQLQTLDLQLNSSSLRDDSHLQSVSPNQPSATGMDVGQTSDQNKNISEPGLVVNGDAETPNHPELFSWGLVDLMPGMNKSISEMLSINPLTIKDISGLDLSVDQHVRNATKKAEDSPSIVPCLIDENFGPLAIVPINTSGQVCNPISREVHSHINDSRDMEAVEALDEHGFETKVLISTIGKSVAPPRQGPNDIVPWEFDEVFGPFQFKNGIFKLEIDENFLGKFHQIPLCHGPYDEDGEW